MYNTHKPDLSELPSSEQLKRSTVTALIIAGVILVTIVLPAEYGIDPTRIGRLLGLTKMGEIKRSLAEEAKEKEQNAEQLAEETDEAPVVVDTDDEIASDSAEDDNNVSNSESLTLTVAPNEAAEVKAVMKKGQKITYNWTTEDGALNFNVHGEPTKSSDGASYEYDSGLNKTKQSGSITAVYDGTHGWFWRNRGSQDVTVTLEVEGEFTTLTEI